MRLPRRLWWLRPNTFQADDDCAVVWTDHLHLRYRERARSLIVFTEPAGIRRHMLIDYESMDHWEPPLENEALSDDDREHVIRKIRRAFAPRGYTVEVINGPAAEPAGRRVTFTNAD